MNDRELIASDYRKAAKDCQSRGLTEAQKEYERLAFMASLVFKLPAEELKIEIEWEDA